MINANRNSYVGYRRRGGVSPPAILDDGNTVGWWDGAEKYMTKDGGNLVSQWADRSGEDNHLLQATGLDQPLWSASGVLFDGIRQFMKASTFPLVQPINIYIVVKQVTWGQDRIFSGNGSENAYLKQLTSTPNITAFAGDEFPLNGDLALDTFGLVEVVFNGASSKTQVDDNSTVTGDFGDNDMDGFTLGSDPAPAEFANIQVKDTIVRKIIDGATGRASIKNYLNSKYSL